MKSLRFSALAMIVPTIIWGFGGLTQSTAVGFFATLFIALPVIFVLFPLMFALFNFIPSMILYSGEDHERFRRTSSVILGLLTLGGLAYLMNSSASPSPGQFTMIGLPFFVTWPWYCLKMDSATYPYVWS